MAFCWIADWQWADRSLVRSACTLPIRGRLAGARSLGPAGLAFAALRRSLWVLPKWLKSADCHLRYRRSGRLARAAALGHQLLTLCLCSVGGAEAGQAAAACTHGRQGSDLEAREVALAGRRRRPADGWCCVWLLCPQIKWAAAGRPVADAEVGHGTPTSWARGRPVHAAGTCLVCCLRWRGRFLFWSAVPSNLIAHHSWLRLGALGLGP